MPKKRKPADVSSAQINAFIAKHACEAENWQALADRIAKELGPRLTASAVRQRGSRLRVTTRGKRVAGVFAPPAIESLETKLAAHMKRRRGTATVEELADTLDVAPGRIRQALAALERSGHNVRIAAGGVELSREIPKAGPLTINVRELEGRTIKFGLTADNHLGSKYARLDVLNALFDIWQSQGVDTVYQLGNIIDGEARFNRFDVLAHGMEGQARYLAKHWPVRKGIKTYFITGDDHEGWYVQREGIEIGRYLEDTARSQGRNDLIYLGHMEHDIVFAGTKQKAIMRLVHAGGGSAYATSYAVQKIVESYQGGEKPQVLLVGHYHKAEYGYPREVHVVQAGCTCDQTPFMRKQKIQAHVGGWTIELTLNKAGMITRFRCEWIPFYDLGHYRKAWSYRDLATPAIAA